MQNNESLATPSNTDTVSVVPKVWTAGTLTYTRSQLGWLFFWLLLGDFTGTLALTAMPMMLPLHLKAHAFSTQQIAWFLGMGNLAAMIVGPITGMWSDRTRTRWGRRRPFVLLTAPVTAIGMVMIPFMTTFWGMNVAVMLVSFAASVAVVNYYLYNDVIPGELMGRFVGAFRFVGFAGALVFQFGLFRYFDSNPKMVWIVCGTVSVVFNMLMLLMVREGTYPPPPPRQPLIHDIKLFLHEGLGTPFMWMLWLTLGMTALGGPAANFFILFFKGDLNMTSTTVGQMMGTGTVLAMVFALPGGWLVDKVGPRRVWAIGGALVGVSQLLMFFLISGKTSGFIMYLIYYGINMLLAAALLPMIFAHLPKEKFGQLVSCQSLVNQGLLFAGNMVVGTLITLTNGNNRMAFLFGGIIYLLSPVFLILMLRCRNPFAHLETSMSGDAK